MIYVKLVAVCDTGGCETTQEYVAEIGSFFVTDDGLVTNELPCDWNEAYDVPRDGGLYRRMVCPNCAKEKA